MNAADLAQKIKQEAARAGYSACGITTTAPFTEFRIAVERRMGSFPEAAHLYEDLLGRADPSARKPWARTILACVRRYGKYALPPGLTGHIGRNYLCDRRYPECPDYPMPRKFKQSLKELGLRVARGGLPDRWVGARAGATSFGRNCFAYSEHGSWINIDSWLLDVELPPDPPNLAPVCPPGCAACIQACPTGALQEPFVMRQDRCIAYLTYYAPEPIDKNLWDRMGTWIYGCDVCQTACPLNEGKWDPLEPAAWIEEKAAYLTPEALAHMDRQTYENIVHTLFFYIPKDDLARWQRNAGRALRRRSGGTGSATS